MADFCVPLLDLSCGVQIVRLGDLIVVRLEIDSF